MLASGSSKGASGRNIGQENWFKSWEQKDKSIIDLDDDEMLEQIRESGQVHGLDHSEMPAAAEEEVYKANMAAAIQNGHVEMPSIYATLAEKCRRSFAFFVKLFWSVAEPSAKLIWGWHMDAVCLHLQRTEEGHIKNLIIAIPPRHTKSVTVSVLFKAWLWARDPGKRTIGVSYSNSLSIRDSRKCRMVVESSQYKALFGETVKLAKDSNKVVRYDTTAGGMVFATSVNGLMTGEGGNYVIADDMHNLKEIHSDLKREGANEIWDKVLSSRLNPPVEKGHFVIIAQRGHSRDLIGHVLEKEKQRKKSTYTCLVLPAEFEVDNRCRTYLGKREDGSDWYWEDPRTEEGELLWPQGCPRSFLEDQKVNLGSWAYAAQYQQRPVPKEGGIFNVNWFGRYLQAELPYHTLWDDSCISVDMNFGSTKKDPGNISFVVAMAWCRVGAKFFVLDMIRGQWKYVEAKKKILAFFIKWHMILAKYIENKANGPAVINDLTETEGMLGIVPIDPKDFGGDKISRANSITPVCEAGNVFLPFEGAIQTKDDGSVIEHEGDRIGREITPLILAELEQFPMGPTNDIVDALTQAINKMRRRFVGMGAGVNEGDSEEQFRKQLEAVEEHSSSIYNQIKTEKERVEYVKSVSNKIMQELLNMNKSADDGNVGAEVIRNLKSIKEMFDDARRRVKEEEEKKKKKVDDNFEFTGVGVDFGPEERTIKKGSMIDPRMIGDSELNKARDVGKPSVGLNRFWNSFGNR
jgi:predicted phage terminase large subunit-like protein